MLSIDDMRDLLNDPTLSDDEVVALRDTCQAIAESIVETCKARRDRGQANDPGMSLPATLA